MARAFVTGIGGQDGGYLAERLVADGVDVHALAHEAEPLPDVPGVELHVGDLTRTDEVRRLVLDLAPDEIYNLAARELGGTVVGGAGPDGRRERGRGGGAARHGVPAPGAARAAGPGAAGLERRDLRTAWLLPAGRVDAGAAGQPVRRREGVRAPDVRRLPAPRPARRRRDPLQPRVASAAADVRHPQDRRDRRRRRAGRGRPAGCSATSTPAATGAGRPTTSTRWCGPPGRIGPTTTS